MKRLLIISDLHAFTPTKETQGKEPSLLTATRPEQGQIDMITQIGAVLAEEDLEVDAILCPGDLADKAEPEAQKFVWSLLDSLKNDIGARHLIGTAGNHDLDSRNVYSAFDPKGNLLGLAPSFPGPLQMESDRYWARNFSVFEEGGVRIVNLNSAAFHGYASDQPSKEYLHGRVADRTIANIVDCIDKRDDVVNVLLTHHHIYKSEDIYDADYSEMHGSVKLLDRLAVAAGSPWLVIHGHQHYPSLQYGTGNALQPVVLAAGSATARISGQYAQAAPNQFYFLELSDEAKAEGWDLCGTIRAWHWSNGTWEKSNSRFKIPNLAGFGCRLNYKAAARKVEEVITTKGVPYLTLSEIFSVEPQLKFLMPREMSLMLEELKSRNFTVVETFDLYETTIRK